MAETKNAVEMIEEMNTTFIALKEAVEKKADAETINKIQDTLDKLEVKSQQINTTPLEVKGEMSKEQIEYKSAFDNYIRTGANENLSAIEVKGMSSDSNPDGGYMVPFTMASQIVERVRQMSPIRQIANIVSISNSGEYKIPRESTDDFDSGWVGERQERPETNTGKVEMVKIPLHEQYAQPALTRTLIQDSNFNWEEYANKKISNKFARQEGSAFVLGDGVNKPLGFLYKPDTQGIEIVNTALGFDGLMDLMSALLEEYLPNAGWLLNRLTLRDIRKLKDGQGRYLWEPSTQVGKPNTILGFDYNLATDMPTPGTNALSVAFGDFRQAYTIVDGAGMYSLRDEYTKKPNILLYTTRRVGGGLEMPDALKILKQS